MKRISPLLLILVLIGCNQQYVALEPIEQSVFHKQPLNFGEATKQNDSVIRLQNGHIVLKKVTIPAFKNGTDASIKLTVRSNGDRWDKSGSCFVIKDLEKLSILDVSRDGKEFPENSSLKDYPGVLASESYNPVIELMRFMTPFGVGHYSTDEDKNRRPVYVPKWEKEVVWEKDITELISLVSGEFYVGVWIDTWTKEGYEIDLGLSYSNRSQKQVKVMSLANTVPYVNGQKLPDFFADTTLNHQLELTEVAKNAKLHYTVTGHGGHSGGDEFIKIKSSIYFDSKLVLDTIPWRDDCASFRRFNPTSGVWLKKDSASYIDFKARKYMVKEIEERIASSDLSRSNWCPGSKVEPFVIELGNLSSGTHDLKIQIPATTATEDKLNHWLVSAYVTYE